MQCPKCHQTLSTITFAGVSIQTCPACGGDWLDAGELGNIARARQSRFTPEECIAVARAAPITGTPAADLHRHLTCPKCGSQTHAVNYGEDTGLIIDECDTCGGVWLDKGELEKIEELVEGWDDGLPQDMAQYGPKLRQISADVNTLETVHISHFRLINAMINGILDILGD